jgi:PAS domain-containing protein
VARVGSGAEYAACLSALPFDHLVAEPQLVRDSARDLTPGADLADLRFVASALRRSSSGEQFGVLVIADRVPRPEFCVMDFRALADLAGTLPGKMELRMTPALALESELLVREAEQSICGILNAAPVPLLYRRADGVCQFVNHAWLDFSARI